MKAIPQPGCMKQSPNFNLGTGVLRFDGPHDMRPLVCGPCVRGRLLGNSEDRCAIGYRSRGSVHHKARCSIGNERLGGLRTGFCCWGHPTLDPRACPAGRHVRPMPGPCPMG
jgi:hypothetical protein